MDDKDPLTQAVVDSPLWALVEEIERKRLLFGGPVVLTVDESTKLVYLVKRMMLGAVAQDQQIRRLRGY